jgi:hypothetical protein
MKYFLDYITEVIAAYHENTASGNLSTRLGHFTPANAKKECIAVCMDRFNRQDERVLRGELYKSN